MTDQESKDYLINEGHAANQTAAEEILTRVKASNVYTQYISDNNLTPPDIGEESWVAIKG